MAPSAAGPSPASSGPRAPAAKGPCNGNRGGLRWHFAALRCNWDRNLRRSQSRDVGRKLKPTRSASLRSRYPTELGSRVGLTANDGSGISDTVSLTPPCESEQSKLRWSKAELRHWSLEAHEPSTPLTGPHRKPEEHATTRSNPRTAQPPLEASAAPAPL